VSSAQKEDGFGGFGGGDRTHRTATSLRASVDFTSAD
jgi:hypothetical protein